MTSPPYWGLRDYGCDGQLGLEKTPEEYVKKIVELFREVKRVLKKDGTLWLNLGDSYVARLNRTGNNGYNDDRANRRKRMTPGLVKGLKPKDLVGIPWRVAFALQADGWWLRQDIIWHKPNPMPESCKDRCTKAHEYIFLLSKSAKYYYDNEAIKEPIRIKGNANSFRGGCYVNGEKDNTLLGKRKVSGNTKIKIPSGWETGKGSHSNFHKKGRSKETKYNNLKNYGGGGTSFKGHSGNYKANGELINADGKKNKRSVWTVATKPFKKAHFATFPPKLIEPCILAGCPKNGIVLDPFMGAGTTALVARENNRNFIGIELNQDYIDIANQRISQAQLSLF